MTVIELIKVLEQHLVEAGNLTVRVHDGMDPSDLMPVQFVEFSRDHVDLTA